jgi:hypothetical protein
MGQQRAVIKSLFGAVLALCMLLDRLRKNEKKGHDWRLKRQPIAA